MVEVVYTAERTVNEIYLVGKKINVDVTDDLTMLNFRNSLIDDKELKPLLKVDGIVDDGLVSLIVDEKDSSFWVGFFFNTIANIPSGYDFILLPKSRVYVTWVKGEQSLDEIYGQNAVAQSMLALKNGKLIDEMSILDNVYYYYYKEDRRRFNPSNDVTILDYGFYLNQID
jgi:hypothetical protein